MGIGFVDEAIVPDVQTDEYESDDSNKKDNNIQYEILVKGGRTTTSYQSGREVNQRMRLVTHHSFYSPSMIQTRGIIASNTIHVHS